MSYKMASPDRYMLLRAFARENRKNATLAEQVLWVHLRKEELGTRFLRQHIIGDFIVDFYAPDFGLGVEVYGGYHAEREQEEDDEARTEMLEQMGCHVIRFTNEKVLFDTENTLELIENNLK